MFKICGHFQSRLKPVHRSAARFSCSKIASGGNKAKRQALFSTDSKSGIPLAQKPNASYPTRGRSVNGTKLEEWNTVTEQNPHTRS